MSTESPQPSGTPGFILYEAPDGRSRLSVRLDGRTVWLTQAQMGELFQTTKQNISLHVQNVLDEGELPEGSVVKEYLTTAADGKSYTTKHYSLDMIITVGYRVRSKRGTQFRQWATATLAEYLTKGFAIDDARLKEGRNLGADYFDELVSRMRDTEDEGGVVRVACELPAGDGRGWHGAWIHVDWEYAEHTSHHPCTRVSRPEPRDTRGTAGASIRATHPSHRLTPSVLFFFPDIPIA